MKSCKLLIIIVLSFFVFKSSLAMNAHSKNTQVKQKRSLKKLNQFKRRKVKPCIASVPETNQFEPFTFESFTDDLVLEKLLLSEFKEAIIVLPTVLNQLDREIDNQRVELCKKIDVRFNEISSSCELFASFASDPLFREKIKSLIIQERLNLTFIGILTRILETPIDEDEENLAIEALLSKDANLNEKNGKGDTPLHMAVDCGRIKIVKLLLDKHANVDEKDADGNTALHIAVAQGYTDIVKELLANHADINIRARDGQTALHIAIKNVDQSIIELLVAKD